MNYNILLPTDFSDNSWNAIKYALRLFEDKNCTFFLLNTYTPTLYKMEYTASAYEYDIDTIGTDTSIKGLKDLKEKILDNL